MFGLNNPRIVQVEQCRFSQLTLAKKRTLLQKACFAEKLRIDTGHYFAQLAECFIQL